MSAEKKRKPMGRLFADRAGNVRIENGRRIIPLELRSALAYLDPGNDAIIRIDGVPDGMTVAGATDLVGGAWQASVADVERLNVEAPGDYSQRLPLNIAITRPSPAGDGTIQTVAAFGLLLTPEGSTSAFGGLEPEEDNEPDQGAMVNKLGLSIRRGRGKEKPKIVKKALNFGRNDATSEYVGHRSSAYLDALLRGDFSHQVGVSHHVGEPEDVALGAEQRSALTQALSSNAVPHADLLKRISDLELELEQARADLAQYRMLTEDKQQQMRQHVIELEHRLSREHAEEVAKMERKLRGDANDAIETARLEWGQFVESEPSN